MKNIAVVYLWKLVMLSGVEAWFDSGFTLRLPLRVTEHGLMKKILACFICVFVSIPLFHAQKRTEAGQNPYARIDRLLDNKTDSLNSIAAVAGYINRTFTSEYEKTRAIFYWITQNITYAPELMYSFTTNENRSRLAKDVFENRTGVCIGYAVLFDTLCKLSNISSYVVLGSTRQSFLPSITGHAWNAVKIFDVWQLIDATWGSGYLQGNRFIKKLNDSYFLPDPEKLIATHLPLDPIWQLLKRPVTLYQFHSQLRSTITTDWSYSDSIRQYLNSAELIKIKSTARRLNEFGNNSEVTANYSLYLKSKEYEFYNGRLNLALKNYNRSVEQFNDYVDFKNHQFTPVRPDEEIRKIMPQISSGLDESEKEYMLVISQISEVNYIDNINSNLKQIRELKERVTEEKKFVDKYLSTKKNKRRDLFYTKIYTVYGVPIKQSK